MLARAPGVKQLAMVMVVLIGLAACSSFSLLYSFAEGFVIAETEFFLEPEDDDAEFIKLKVHEGIKWHTAVMLPRYARAFSSWADIVEAGPLTRETTTLFLKELRLLINDLIIGGTPFAAEVLVRHTSPAQIKGLGERLAEKMAELREDYQDLDEQFEERSETITDNIERITGTLNDQQRARITAYVKSREGSIAGWLENRQMRQNAFLSFLAGQPEQAQITSFLIQITLRPHEIVDPQYRANSEERWAAIGRMMFDVMSTLTEVQRRESVKNLRDYAADMLEVSSP